MRYRTQNVCVQKNEKIILKPVNFKKNLYNILTLTFLRVQLWLTFLFTFLDYGAPAGSKLLPPPKKTTTSCQPQSVLDIIFVIQYVVICITCPCCTTWPTI